jgi:N-methylhydantoinase A
MTTSPDAFPQRISADIGGTFTDIAYMDVDGTVSVTKLLSTPGNYANAVIDGIKELASKRNIPLSSFDEVLHGCTVATNAILEHKGARTALITTRGFRDVLELRRIRTPKLYDPLWRNPTPLVPRHLRFEVSERTGAGGEVVLPLDLDDVRAVVKRIAEAKVEAIAVCLINSFANPVHERKIGEILEQELPDAFLSLSVDILPQIREYERTSTTVINSYVGPPVESYISSMVEQLASNDIGNRAVGCWKRKPFSRSPRKLSSVGPPQVSSARAISGRSAVMIISSPSTWAARQRKAHLSRAGSSAHRRNTR